MRAGNGIKINNVAVYQDEILILSVFDNFIMSSHFKMYYISPCNDKPLKPHKLETLRWQVGHTRKIGFSWCKVSQLSYSLLINRPHEHTVPLFVVSFFFWPLAFVRLFRHLIFFSHHYDVKRQHNNRRA